MSFYNTKNLSGYLENDCTVVITGDSLAYNRYDFVAEQRQNAWECPLAMKSWSFLLRDYLISHGRGWVPAREIPIEGEDISLTPFTEINKRVPLNEKLPMEDHGISIVTKTQTDIKIKGCPKKILYVVTNSGSGSGFRSKENNFDLTGNKELFNGIYIKSVKNDGILQDVKSNSTINLIGVSDVLTKVFLTGSGSKTAEWLLENIDNRIMKHKPDLCFIIIGANNRRKNNPQSFRAAFEIIAKKLLNSGVEVVILTPPHSNTSDPEEKDDIYNPNPEITKPILDAIHEIALMYNLTCINLFELFSGIPSHIWRFDNTHFTKEGNLILYEKIIQNLFGGI